MNDFITLPFSNQVGIIFLASAFLGFVVFLFIVIFKITKPKSISKDSIAFKGSEDSQEESDTILHNRLFTFLENTNAPGYLALEGSTDKSVLCENYLKIKFRALHEGLYAFFKKSENHDFDNLECLPSVINTIIAEYEEVAKTMVTHTTGGDICGIPKCFSQKFAKWHQRHATQLFDDYSNALSDKQYITSRERALVMASATFYALRETIQDARYTLDNLNGDLERELAEMIKLSCLDK